MSVNEVQIRVGQKWKTYLGRVVTIDRMTEKGFLVIDETGSTYEVNERGQSDATAFLAVDLESLVAEADTFEYRAACNMFAVPILNVSADGAKTFANREEVMQHIAEHGSEPGRVFLVGREVQPGEGEPAFNVNFAGTTDETVDADQLASETLSALGWTFDGQCWVQPEQVNWPTGTQSALDIQHGGSHYKGFAIQPVEFIHANGVPFIEGNCIKYLMRWREKGGVKDLDKVKHYVDLLIELEAKHTKAF